MAPKKMRDWLAPVFAVIGGFILGTLVFAHFGWTLPPEYAPYLSVAALAGLDTALGGTRARIEGRFQNDIFATGFVLNSLLAWGLAWFGDHIGVNFGLVAVLVLGARVFNNLSLIRRFYLNNLALARRKLQEENAALSPAPTVSQKTEWGSPL